MKITECNEADIKKITNDLIKFNASQVPFTQSDPFIKVNYKIEEGGEVIAGILASIYCWGCVYISILHVHENYRGKGYGRKLLKKVESMAKSHSCNIIHLDTFDFQAKGFYIKEGYEVFGELSNCPKNHTRIFLKKEI